jgi:hypothetical protein
MSSNLLCSSGESGANSQTRGIPASGAQQRREPERLREEATTRPLKEQLEDTIAQHEQIAEEIERASEVRPNKEPAEDGVERNPRAAYPGAPPICSQRAGLADPRARSKGAMGSRR